MASIFKRPGLVAVEIAWRWAFGGLLLLVICLTNDEAYAHRYDPTFWRGFLNAVLNGNATFDPHTVGMLGVIAVVLLWAVLCSALRFLLLRRLDANLRWNPAASIALTLMRVAIFLLLLGIWVLAALRIYRSMVLLPGARGEYPSYVPAFALFTTFTLLLFMLWSITSWIFPLAATLAMFQRLTLGQSLRAAWRSRTLRSKLIEINLVMGIVKVSLLVLTLVFSACPLPFSNVETQTFLNWWWFGCFLFWIVSSDYFHVVRAAAVLRLTQAYTRA